MKTIPGFVLLEGTAWTGLVSHVDIHLVQDGRSYQTELDDAGVEVGGRPVCKSTVRMTCRGGQPTVDWLEI